MATRQEAQEAMLAIRRTRNRFHCWMVAMKTAYYDMGFVIDKLVLSNEIADDLMMMEQMFPHHEEIFSLVVRPITGPDGESLDVVDPVIFGVPIMFHELPTFRYLFRLVPLEGPMQP